VRALFSKLMSGVRELRRPLLFVAAITTWSAVPILGVYLFRRGYPSAGGLILLAVIFLRFFKLAVIRAAFPDRLSVLRGFTVLVVMVAALKLHRLTDSSQIQSAHENKLTWLISGIISLALLVISFTSWGSRHLGNRDGS